MLFSGPRIKLGVNRKTGPERIDELKQTEIRAGTLFILPDWSVALYNYLILWL